MKTTNDKIYCAGCGKELPSPSSTSQDVFYENDCYYFVHLQVAHRGEMGEHNDLKGIEENIIGRLNHPSFCGGCASKLIQSKASGRDGTMRWYLNPCGCRG